jgi:hypothetical protein
MQTDVLAVALTATGTAVTGRCRVKGYQISSDSVAATDIVFRDGSASGATRLSLGVSIGSQSFGATLPGQGVLFVDGVHVTLPATVEITILYA